MRLELETNLAALDALIEKIGDALADPSSPLLAELRGREIPSGKLPTVDLSPAELLMRLKKARKEIETKEFAVLNAAHKLDHAVAETLGWPGNPAADPFRSALQLLRLNSPAAAKAMGLPDQALRYLLVNGGSRANSLSWSFPNGATTARRGSAPNPPTAKKTKSAAAKKGSVGKHRR